MSSAAKMSEEVGDVQSDEDCEELAEDGLSFSADISEKTRRKRSSGKPPPSPRSPYLSTINMNPRRAAVAAWRLPRASLGDARGDTPGEMGSSRHTSLSNGHDLSQTLRSDCDVTSEFLKQTLAARKHKHLHSASNGFSFGSSDYRTKEDMYDEIIRLKKSLHEHKADNHKMKAKVRRLEEDNAKREKQLEELLNPKKGSDYTRSLVDKKKEGSVVLNGLKQRILKLEQQCREKENALSKLQSELRTTNLEELKITVETYFEEIQRLRMLLESTEKSSRAESKCSQRQQKALSSTVLQLSESLKQLQQENTELREELNTESPAGGVKGYREWSKQRMLRRLFELEKRLEDRRRPSTEAKTGTRLDREVQTTPPKSPDAAREVTMATEARVSAGVNTEEWDGTTELRGRISQLEAEGAELRGMLANKDDELKRLKAEREEAEKETERQKAEREQELDKERQQCHQELEQLRGRIQTLEEEQDRPVNPDPPSSPPAMQDEETQTSASTEEGVEGGEGGASGGRRQSEGGGHERLARGGEAETGRNGCPERRDEAARIIQTKWREHRQKDIVKLQSALRGHLLRESQLKDLLRDTRNKKAGASDRGDNASSLEEELDGVSVTMIQSAIRGHLARCGFNRDSSGSSVPFSAGDSLPALMPRKPRSTHTASRAGSAHSERPAVEENPWPVPSARTPRISPASAQSDLSCTAEPAVDSDDSDDIIVSPSRPLRSREVLIL